MKNNKISKTRQNRILEILGESGEVKVNDLSEEFKVTPITIRRDLDRLAEKGLVDRIHGGAIVSQKMRDEASFYDKGSRFVYEKKRIAKAAAELINSGDTIFMNSGSTTLELLKNIREKHVRVITNNAAAINVKTDPQVELFFVGGEYREASNSLVGDMALSALSQAFSSWTFLGVNGINVDLGLTSSVQQETGINRLMVENCQGPVVVLADSSKLGAVSNFPTASISQVSILVTDSKAEASQVEMFENIGIKVILA